MLYPTELREQACAVYGASGSDDRVRGVRTPVINLQLIGRTTIEAVRGGQFGELTVIK